MGVEEVRGKSHGSARFRAPREETLEKVGESSSNDGGSLERGVEDRNGGWLVARGRKGTRLLVTPKT